MRRVFASSLLSLLLVSTLVWGGCISCEQYFMWPGVKSCCAPDGHCKTKAPTKEKAGRECKQIAFENHKSIDWHVDLTIAFVTPTQLTAATVVTFARWEITNRVEPSPPDLQVLHSTFLI
jgi:hypothetical protein